ncbi:MAG: VPDSG-CTERM sorting domain-containing protein [Verrucomicrobia bacterium]|nr:VPDSG-CTERM sorting domain-containing protein [Verrucomicrobiota bacterium]
MKSLVTALTLGAAAAAVTVPAHAIAYSYQDFDPINKVLFTGVLGSVEHESTFDITNNDGDAGPNIVGFNKDTEKLIGGYVEFELWGTEIGGGLQKEKARFTLGSLSFNTPGQQILGTQIYGGNLTVSLLADLQADGSLDYRVRLIDQGLVNIDTVVLKSANLVAHVPDSGSTMALLGAGMLGLVAVRSRRS